jgi:hypothetical protein
LGPDQPRENTPGLRGQRRVNGDALVFTRRTGIGGSIGWLSNAPCGSGEDAIEAFEARLVVHDRRTGCRIRLREDGRLLRCEAGDDGNGFEYRHVR